MSVKTKKPLLNQGKGELDLVQHVYAFSILASLSLVVGWVAYRINSVRGFINDYPMLVDIGVATAILFVINVIPNSGLKKLSNTSLIISFYMTAFGTLGYAAINDVQELNLTLLLIVFLALLASTYAVLRQRDKQAQAAIAN